MKTKKTQVKRAGIRTTKIMLWATAEEKQIIQEAAKQENRSLTNYMITASLERAKAAR